MNLVTPMAARRWRGARPAFAAPLAVILVMGLPHAGFSQTSPGRVDACTLMGTCNSVCREVGDACTTSWIGAAHDAACCSGCCETLVASTSGMCVAASQCGGPMPTPTNTFTPGPTRTPTRTGTPAPIGTPTPVRTPTPLSPRPTVSEASATRTPEPTPAPSQANSGSYEPHEYIRIASDAAFLTPLSGVVRGSGSAADPYVIEGWDIVGYSGGIYVAHTRAHLVIRANRIVGGTDYGISLDDVDNVTVEENVLSDDKLGVSVATSRGVAIRDNFVEQQWHKLDAGFQVTDSHGVAISGNDLRAIARGSAEGRSYAIEVTGSQPGASGDVVVAGNDIDRCEQGIFVAVSDGVTIAGNRIRRVPNNPLTVASSTSVEIVENDVRDTGDEGIEIVPLGGEDAPIPATAPPTSGVVIARNTLANNRDIGIKIDTAVSGGLTITGNHVEGNADGIAVLCAADRAEVTDNTILDNRCGYAQGSTAEYFGNGITFKICSGFGEGLVARNRIRGHRRGIVDVNCRQGCRFESNEVLGNEAGIIAMTAATTVVSGNRIAGNGIGIDGSSISQGWRYDARGNWWGSASGPGGGGPGSGDLVTSNVDFAPWAQQALAAGPAGGSSAPINAGACPASP
ncbi:MAG: hypothetical protein QOD06_2394 [Candidatus Binatota bacterium]|nr:hypothetical protein [Candidatus Binatota bacterium]